MKTLFVSDLDGTLFNSDAELSERTIEVINSFISQGMYFTAATARSVYSVIPKLKGLNVNVPCILMNGVSIFDMENEEYVRNVCIPCEKSADIVRFFEESGQKCFMYKFVDGKLTCFYTEMDSAHMQSFADIRKNTYKKPFVKCESLYDVIDENTVYFTKSGKYEVLAHVYEKIKQTDGVSCAFYKDTYDDVWYLEAFSENASKENAVRYLKEKYGFDKVVAFGDNRNDMGMLKYADVSVVVHNAPEEVREIADVVTLSNDDDGVAEYMLNMKGQILR